MSFSLFDDWKAVRSPDAQPGGIPAGLAAIGRGGGGGCGLRVKRNRSPDTQRGIFWLRLGDCSSSTDKNRIRSFNLSFANYDD